MSRILIAACLVLSYAAVTQASEIHDAISSGDIDLVQRLIAESPELLESMDNSNHTPFLWAASEGQLEIAKYLLDAGADPDVQNYRGSTALHLASYNGHIDVVRYLLEIGAEIDAINSSGFTPLMHAAYMGQTDVGELLVENGASLHVYDDHWSGAAVHWACVKADTSFLIMLREHGADIEHPSPDDSSMPIFWAAYNGNQAAMQYLIDAGISANATEPSGATPLHNSARRGDTACARILLENGAEIEAMTDEEITPLVAALNSESLEMVKFLVDRGANINHIDGNGMNTAHFAAFWESPEALSYLIKKGVAIDVVDSFGTTPLYRAIRNGREANVRLLVESGARIDPASPDEDPVLSIAVKEGRNDVVQLLLDHGASVDVLDNTDRRTPLHWASLKGYLAIVEMLASHGADPNVIDNSNHTPLYYAGRYGHRDVAEHLKSLGATSDDYVENIGKSRELKIDFGDGEAAVWYLGHCGYAIKTRDHLLIFDYWNRGEDPSYPCLANGHIDPKEIAGENTFVFITHEHRDHLDTTVFTWHDQLDNIEYIAGCMPERLPQYSEIGYSPPAYTFMGPHQDTTIGDVHVTTIKANDAGVGYLVEVDDLKIYHAGDHAGWAEGRRDAYVAEIDYLADRVQDLDFAFVNVTGCHTHDTTALLEGTLISLNKLNPKFWFPTHGLDMESVYLEFSEKVRAAGRPNTAVCPENRGDVFVFRGGKLL